MPAVEVPGPEGVIPEYFFFSRLRGVEEVVPAGTGATRGSSNFGDYVAGLSPSVPRELEVRRIVIIPALTPVVVPVT